MNAMQRLGGCSTWRIHHARTSNMLNWARSTNTQPCLQTVVCRAQLRTEQQQQQRSLTLYTTRITRLQQQRQQHQFAHGLSCSFQTSDRTMYPSSPLQRRFLARTTHQRLKTASTENATAHRHQHHPSVRSLVKKGTGYVPPYRVPNIRKMKKYVSGYSSTTTAPDSLATPTFEPRPTGRISEELEILCSALRQVGARQVFYGPNIHVVDTPKKCADALALMQEYYKTLRGGIGAVGFDSETTVYRTWESSTNNRTSILQIATEDVCLIVQLFYMTREGQERGRIPDILREFLEDPNQLKVGVSIENDAAELLRGYGLKVQGLVDLGKMALEKNSTSLTSLEDLDYMYGAEDWSVVKTDDIYRWDFDGQVLHRDAIWYSAVDALACKAIYENMLRNKYKSTYVPWEERFPMTPEEEYDDVIEFLHFKIKSKRIYPVDSIKILLTKSYPRLRQIHKPEKLNEIADNYIAKLLKDGVLVVDKKNASEEDLQLKPDQINATAYPGLALKFLYEMRPQNKDQALKNSSTEPVDSPENLIASAVQEGDAQKPTTETIAHDNTNDLASASTEPKQNNPSSS